MIIRDGISEIDGLHPQRISKGVNHSYSYFTLVMDLERLCCTRDEFITALKAENIDCAVHYPIPLMKQPAIKQLMKTESCPISEEISEKIFSLPIHPYLTDKNLNEIREGVEKVATYFHR